MTRCRFDLGIAEPRWHSLVMTRGPAFISDWRLYQLDRKSLYPRSDSPMHAWALDSGAFSMLNGPGRWVISLEDYVRHRVQWAEQFGEPAFAAAQDYMCEPPALAKTGLTIERYVELCRAGPQYQWLPVVQGWERDDYLRHVDDYMRAGIDLREQPLVGVGSTCRRQGTHAAGQIYELLFSLGLRLHGFGVSLGGIRRYHQCLVSADSMAWADAAKKESIDRRWAPNSIAVAELYRDRIEAAIDGYGEDEAAERWNRAMRTWVRPKWRADGYENLPGWTDQRV